MWKLITRGATVIGLIASVLGILAFVCVPTPIRSLDVPDASASPSARVATAPTTAPSRAPSVPPALATPSGTGSPCGELAPRPAASVNGMSVLLPTAGGCLREPFYADTGGSVWMRYQLGLPTGWVAYSASWKAVAHRDGGRSTPFDCVPVLRFNGPFKGSVDLLDGGIRVVPVEWADSIAARVVAMQRALVPPSKEPCLQIVVYDG